MRLPKWMTIELFPKSKSFDVNALSSRFENLKRAYEREIALAKAQMQRPRYVELKAFDSDDQEAQKKLAQISRSDEFRFFIEGLRQDVYSVGIIKQSDEKQILNAAMKLKGIELVIQELHKIELALEAAVDNAA